MTSWDYRVLVRGFDKKDNFVWVDEDPRSGEERLNAMGADGWELVQVLTISRPGSSGWAGLTTAMHYIFKRPGV